MFEGGVTVFTMPARASEEEKADVRSVVVVETGKKVKSGCSVKERG